MIEDAERPAAGELAWYVAHTRPRCEKKLAEYCEREGISVTLPLYKSVKKYPGKVVTFEKPLFPNYLFLRLPPRWRSSRGISGSDASGGRQRRSASVCS